MGSTIAYSHLFAGVEIVFKGRDYERKVTRYEPQTGAPIEVPAVAIEITAFGPDGKIEVLPENKEIYADAKRKNCHLWEEDWRRQHIFSRISEWFTSKGVKEAGWREFGVIGWHQGYIGEEASKNKDVVGCRVIGIEIASGESWDNPQVSVLIPDDVGDRMRHFIDRTFKKRWIPQLILQTKTG